MTTAATAVLDVPVGQIKTVEGHNPRTVFEGLDELAASIKQHGVLVPLIVKLDVKNGAADPTFELVAGERRLRAAKLAKVKTVPVVVRQDESVADTAMIENLQRNDLTPVEEARAYERILANSGRTVAGLSQVLNVTEHRIESRLLLLTLPENTLGRVAGGKITLGATETLAKIAAASPDLADKVSEIISGDLDIETYGEEPVDSASFVFQPDQVVDIALDQELNDEGARLPIFQRGDLEHDTWLERISPLTVGNEQVAEAATKLELALATLPDEGRYSYGPRYRAFSLDREDYDAARVYGCLLEVGRSSYFTDVPWLLDRITLKVEYQARELAKREKAEARAKGEPEAAKPRKGETPEEAQARVEAAKKTAAAEARDREREEAIAVHDRNVALGINLRKKLAAPKVTADLMRLVALLLLDEHVESFANAWRLVDEDQHEAKRRKDGTLTKWQHPKPNDPGSVEAVTEMLAKAKTPEQILGVVLQWVTATRWADTAAVPASQRHGISVNAINHAYTTDEPARDLIDKALVRYLTPAVRESHEATVAERKRRGW